MPMKMTHGTGFIAAPVVRDVKSCCQVQQVLAQSGANPVSRHGIARRTVLHLEDADLERVVMAYTRSPRTGSVAHQQGLCWKITSPMMQEMMLWCIMSEESYELGLERISRTETE